jgi:hypothetical protein
MAWCPACAEDRPITRQIFTSECPYCTRSNTEKHEAGCRGPTPGCLDVCTHCNSPVFALAKIESDYKRLAKAGERRIGAGKKNEETTRSKLWIFLCQTGAGGALVLGVLVCVLYFASERPIERDASFYAKIMAVSGAVAAAFWFGARQLSSALAGQEEVEALWAKQREKQRRKAEKELDGD